ncbi:MAG: hypothetical protein QM765_43395 [Myxococcales bacterium]
MSGRGAGAFIFRFHSIERILVVGGAGDHQAQAAVVGAADPGDVHLLVEDVGGVRPVLEAGPAARPVRLVPELVELRQDLLSRLDADDVVGVAGVGARVAALQVGRDRGRSLVERAARVPPEQPCALGPVSESEVRRRMRVQIRNAPNHDQDSRALGALTAS